MEFSDQVSFGAFGPIAASSICGLMAVEELLGVGHETQVREAIQVLLKEIVSQARCDAEN